MAKGGGGEVPHDENHLRMQYPPLLFCTSFPLYLKLASAESAQLGAIREGRLVFPLQPLYNMGCFWQEKVAVAIFMLLRNELAWGGGFSQPIAQYGETQ